MQGVGEQVLVELDFVTVADWQAQGFELVARVVEGVVQSVVDKQLGLPKGIVGLVELRSAQ